jgi:hypothetical protein
VATGAWRLPRFLYRDATQLKHISDLQQPQKSANAPSSNRRPAPLLRIWDDVDLIRPQLRSNNIILEQGPDTLSTIPIESSSALSTANVDFTVRAAEWSCLVHEAIKVAVRGVTVLADTRRLESFAWMSLNHFDI